MSLQNLSGEAVRASVREPNGLYDRNGVLISLIQPLRAGRIYDRFDYFGSMLAQAAREGRIHILPEGSEELFLGVRRNFGAERGWVFRALGNPADERAQQKSLHQRLGVRLANFVLLVFGLRRHVRLLSFGASDSVGGAA